MTKRTTVPADPPTADLSKKNIRRLAKLTPAEVNNQGEELREHVMLIAALSKQVLQRLDAIDDAVRITSGADRYENGCTLALALAEEVALTESTREALLSVAEMIVDEVGSGTTTRDRADSFAKFFVEVFGSADRFVETAVAARLATSGKKVAR